MVRLLIVPLLMVLVLMVLVLMVPLLMDPFLMVPLEGTGEVNKNPKSGGMSTRGHDWKLFKKRVNLDAGNLSLEIGFATNGTSCRGAFSM